MNEDTSYIDADYTDDPATWTATTPTKATCYDPNTDDTLPVRPPAKFRGMNQRQRRKRKRQGTKRSYQR